MVRHARAVLAVGSRLPALSVAWRESEDAVDSGFTVIFSDFDPGFADDAARVLCLHCLVDEGDEQLARGLELARQFGQVDWDVAAGEWFVPEDDE